jgi:hypothetical protein
LADTLFRVIARGKIKAPASSSVLKNDSDPVLRNLSSLIRFKKSLLKEKIPAWYVGRSRNKKGKPFDPPGCKKSVPCSGTGAKPVEGDYSGYCAAG